MEFIRMMASKRIKIVQNQVFETGSWPSNAERNQSHPMTICLKWTHIDNKTVILRFVQTKCIWVTSLARNSWLDIHHWNSIIEIYSDDDGKWKNQTHWKSKTGTWPSNEEKSNHIHSPFANTTVILGVARFWNWKHPGNFVRTKPMLAVIKNSAKSLGSFRS